jgi:hypothetical protein
VRKYRTGDEFVGIVSDNASIVGNSWDWNEEEMKNWEKSHELVGLLWQLDFNKNQVNIKWRKVFTKDWEKIGLLLANWKILIK